ncbi:presenilin-associated rhomboid-like protein, mitochondrial [Physella acuta]|uniref:presenilin-associated rhomboid-like protein, mitochondrial n=1 Tax=Physella acuta TaxID=109671 RepID=UPI0027DACAC4|nr:presenilin-associated rhomboid-like protein, mitochondrial [Physella acuta]
MALPYSYCRQLLKPQKLVNVKHVLSTKICAESSNLFSFWTKTRPSELYRFQRTVRNFQTRRKLEDVRPQNTGSPSLLKPLVYTVGVCGCSFVVAMVMSYEKMRKIFKDLHQGNKKEAIKTHQKTLSFRENANSMWSQLSNGQKMVMGIIAANIGVFVLWRIPRLQNSMMRYFTTAITHPVPSMTLSSFSHVSFLHLCVNMYVLWSFASVTVNLMGPEQFAAFYISAGTVSSFASMACNKLLRRPMVVSLGASGAIMALIGAVCIKFPDARLGIAFISDIFPHSFSADTGMKAILVFDIAGLLLGWRFLDHAGHLGGILFGILYTKYGNSRIWGNRERIMRWWHDVRGKP